MRTFNFHFTATAVPGAAQRPGSRSGTASDARPCPAPQHPAAPLPAGTSLTPVCHRAWPCRTRAGGEGNGGATGLHPAAVPGPSSSTALTRRLRAAGTAGRRLPACRTHLPMPAPPHPLPNGFFKKKIKIKIENEEVGWKISQSQLGAGARQQPALGVSPAPQRALCAGARRALVQQELKRNTGEWWKCL